jgi:hypothetical protein
MNSSTHLALRGVSDTLPEDDVSAWVQGSIIQGYLSTVVATMLIYDSSE